MRSPKNAGTGHAQSAKLRLRATDAVGRFRNADRGRTTRMNADQGDGTPKTENPGIGRIGEAQAGETCAAATGQRQKRSQNAELDAILRIT